MNTWNEILLENESDGQGQLDAICPCGRSVRDHYTSQGVWKPCNDANIAACIG